MNSLINKWCHLDDDARIVIVTDKYMQRLAEDIKRQVSNACQIMLFGSRGYNYESLLSLSQKDLVIALLSIEIFMSREAYKIYQPFGKPKDLIAKYAFIRLNITKESLIQGLSTPKDLIYKTLDQYDNIKTGSKLHVTNEVGTDIVLNVNKFDTCSHEINEDGGMAFLPPSETSADVLDGKSNGKIVVDITIGQLYLYKDLLDWFGLVDQPVTLIVENGLVTNITGGAMAVRLKEKLFSMDPACRKIVELGKGLSNMTPTGNVGVDECILKTCHFGIGRVSECGIHLDVVLSNPDIKVIG